MSTIIFLLGRDPEDLIPAEKIFLGGPHKVYELKRIDEEDPDKFSTLCMDEEPALVLHQPDNPNFLLATITTKHIRHVVFTKGREGSMEVFTLVRGVLKNPW